MKFSDSKRLLFLSVIAGLLCFLAWPPLGYTGFIFFAWVPLFFLKDSSAGNRKFIALLYCSFLIWNAATTWWIWNASAPGAVMAILVNSMLMLLPWLAFQSFEKRTGKTLSYIAFISFWLCFEYIHLQDWGLSWPWLSLGNVFAAYPEWIQWYEFTGTSGGTLWILVANILSYECIRNLSLSGWRNKKAQQFFFSAVGVLILPTLLSLQIRNNFGHKADSIKKHAVVIVQPNTDPYQKIGGTEFDRILKEMIALSREATDSSTRLLIWPETALYTNSGLDEARLKESGALAPLFNFLKEYPQLHLFTGIESYRIFEGKHSLYSRTIPGSSQYYEAYNAAVLLNHSGALHFYHKSMLVPGVETLPRFLLFLGPIFEKFGGSAGGYAKQEERTSVLVADHFLLAPAICYESIYGEYISKYIAHDASLIAVITNDGWWGNTPGYRQHMSYARLRAVEARRWVVRSANTGISCFIDPYGNVVSPLPWWKADVIKKEISPLTEKTFFVQHGDIISKAAVAASILLLIIFIGGSFRKKKLK